MNILAIDTAGAPLSLAVQAGARVRAYERELARPHDETLLPRVRRLLAKSGLRWQDLDALVAASGPGRFTGIRIGMAFASVLAGRLRIPAFAVSRLEAQAAKTPGRLVCAALPGWREETFYQLFRRSAPGSAAVRPAAVALWAGAREWEAIRRELDARGAVLVEGGVGARDLLPRAARLLQSRRRTRFEPLYLKPASYELKARAEAKAAAKG